jgi:hypothetical protein
MRWLHDWQGLTITLSIPAIGLVANAIDACAIFGDWVVFMAILGGLLGGVIYTALVAATTCSIRLYLWGNVGCAIENS